GCDACLETTAGEIRSNVNYRSTSQPPPLRGDQTSMLARRVNPPGGSSPAGVRRPALGHLVEVVPVVDDPAVGVEPQHGGTGVRHRLAVLVAARPPLHSGPVAGDDRFPELALDVAFGPERPREVALDPAEAEVGIPEDQPS